MYIFHFGVLNYFCFLLHWITKYYRCCLELSCSQTTTKYCCGKMLLQCFISSQNRQLIEQLNREFENKQCFPVCCAHVRVTCPVQRPTTRSAIKVSSVSPERWLTITPQPFSWASLHLRAGDNMTKCDAHLYTLHTLCMNPCANVYASYTRKNQLTP